MNEDDGLGYGFSTKFSHLLGNDLMYQFH